MGVASGSATFENFGRRAFGCPACACDPGVYDGDGPARLGVSGPRPEPGVPQANHDRQCKCREREFHELPGSDKLGLRCRPRAAVVPRAWVRKGGVDVGEQIEWQRGETWIEY
jgi:hypothetical protein